MALVDVSLNTVWPLYGDGAGNTIEEN